MIVAQTSIIYNCLSTNIMIIYNLKKINSFNKKSIADYENTLNFNISECPNCGSSKLIKWGKYIRNVIYYKNNKKYENIIEIKRISCNECKKTHSIIPDFLVPYKVHISEYINEVIKNKITKVSTYKIICDRYQVSRQLLKYWLDCFNEHYTRILVTLGETNKKTIIRIISKSIYDFIYEYYCKNKKIYMMYISNENNMPILKWAPT